MKISVPITSDTLYNLMSSDQRNQAIKSSTSGAKPKNCSIENQGAYPIHIEFGADASADDHEISFTDGVSFCAS